jgi:hypothetical protein
MDDSPP